MSSAEPDSPSAAGQSDLPIPNHLLRRQSAIRQQLASNSINLNPAQQAKAHSFFFSQLLPDTTYKPKRFNRNTAISRIEEIKSKPNSARNREAASGENVKSDNSSKPNSAAAAALNSSSRSSSASTLSTGPIHYAPSSGSVPLSIPRLKLPQLESNRLSLSASLPASYIPIPASRFNQSAIDLNFPSNAAAAASGSLSFLTSSTNLSFSRLVNRPIDSDYHSHDPSNLVAQPSRPLFNSLVKRVETIISEHNHSLDIYIGKNLFDDQYNRVDVGRKKYGFFRYFLPQNATALRLDLEVLDGRVELYISLSEMYVFESEKNAADCWIMKSSIGHSSLIIASNESLFKSNAYYYISAFAIQPSSFLLKSSFIGGKSKSHGMRGTRNSQNSEESLGSGFHLDSNDPLNPAAPTSAISILNSEEEKQITRSSRSIKKSVLQRIKELKENPLQFQAHQKRIHEIKDEYRRKTKDKTGTGGINGTGQGSSRKQVNQINQNDENNSSAMENSTIADDSSSTSYSAPVGGFNESAVVRLRLADLPSLRLGNSQQFDENEATSDRQNSTDMIMMSSGGEKNYLYENISSLGGKNRCRSVESRQLDEERRAALLDQKRQLDKDFPMIMEARLQQKYAERKRAKLESEAARMKFLRESLQKRWLYHLAVTHSNQFWLFQMESIEVKRANRARKEAAAQTIQRFVRSSMKRRRAVKANFHFQSFRSAILLSAFNYSQVKKDRAAKVIKFFLEMVSGVDSISRIIKNYRRRVIICQRAIKRFLLSKKSKITLWKLQFDFELAHSMQLNASIIEDELKYKILKEFYSNNIKERTLEYPQYLVKLSQYQEFKEIESAKKLIMKDYRELPMAAPIRPRAPGILEKKIVLNIIRETIKRKTAAKAAAKAAKETGSAVAESKTHKVAEQTVNNQPTESVPSTAGNSSVDSSIPPRGLLSRPQTLDRRVSPVNPPRSAGNDSPSQSAQPSASVSRAGSIIKFGDQLTAAASQQNSSSRSGSNRASPASSKSVSRQSSINRKT